MNNKPALIVKYLFFALSLVEFYAEFIHQRETIFVLKFALLPLLLLYYALNVNGKWNKMHRLMIAAIFFSWVADISLALAPENINDLQIFGIPKNKYFFFGGMGGFLVAHLFFIGAYIQSVRSNAESLFARSKLFFVPIALYGVIMISIIVPRVYANPEKSLAAFPVVIYGSVLCSMASFALNRYGRVNAESFWRVFIGAVLFVISDSMIAMNFLAFENAIPKATLWIMITYLAAEFLIADGMLRTEQA